MHLQKYFINKQYYINYKTHRKMKEIKKIATAENFSAISVGKLNELDEFVLTLNPEVKIPGKYFAVNH